MPHNIIGHCIGKRHLKSWTSAIFLMFHSTYSIHIHDEFRSHPYLYKNNILLTNILSSLNNTIRKELVNLLVLSTCNHLNAIYRLLPWSSSCISEMLKSTSSSTSTESYAQRYPYPQQEDPNTVLQSELLSPRSGGLVPLSTRA